MVSQSSERVDIRKVDGDIRKVEGIVNLKLIQYQKGGLSLTL